MSVGLKFLNFISDISAPVSIKNVQNLFNGSIFKDTKLLFTLCTVKILFSAGALIEQLQQGLFVVNAGTKFVAELLPVENLSVVGLVVAYFVEHFRPHNTLVGGYGDIYYYSVCSYFFRCCQNFLCWNLVNRMFFDSAEDRNFDFFLYCFV